MGGDFQKGAWSRLWRKAAGLSRARLRWPQGAAPAGLYLGIVAAGAVLLLISSKAVGDGWAQNLRSVSLVREMDTDCQGFPSISGVLCFAGHNMAGSLGSSTYPTFGEWSPCQMLWISRLDASRSLPMAAEALDWTAGCRRQSLVSGWAGELAWLQNDRQAAKLWWQKLSNAELVEWGYSLVLDGEIEQGEFLLNLAVERAQPEYSLGTSLRWDPGGAGRSASASAYGEALVKLGLAYRLSGDWAKAVDLYEAAHTLAPQDMEVRFFLGMSYRQTGQPGRARAVLQDGLDTLRTADETAPWAQPKFISDYFVQLGLAYRESGDLGEAIKAFQEAQAWLRRSGAPNPEQERFIEGLLEPGLESNDGLP